MHRLQSQRRCLQGLQRGRAPIVCGTPRCRQSAHCERDGGGDGMKFPSRPYPQSAVDSFRTFIEGGAPSALIELPTGTGKTVTFSMLLESVVQGGKRGLVVAHRKMLI